ncbi:hypothetical protein [Lacrimispora xylanisolvens]|uniref:hypothetical protein n=1 Tax=Lacrimispora xylanisolvens TaxID=384636 RepID=UPI0024027DAC
MTKKEITREIIGNVLIPMGFVSGENINSCWFIRKFKNSKGETARLVVEFYTRGWDKRLFMVINSYSGRCTSYGIQDIVPDSSENGLPCATLKEYKLAIEAYADILKQYGRDFFKKISEPPLENDYFREEDDFRLFKEHDLLAQKFLTEHELDISQMKAEDAIQIIKKIILEKQGESFEHCRNTILELSAFYGRVLGNSHKCRWVMHNCRTHFTCTLNFYSKSGPSLSLHKDISLAWKDGVDKLDSLVIDSL